MAARYKIVTFKGEQLWQGKDDDTVITLLTETHTGIKIRRRLKKNLATVRSDATRHAHCVAVCAFHAVWLY